MMDNKREKFDFAPCGHAIKMARKSKDTSRNKLADQVGLAPRYLASIENDGQHPSLQTFYELVTRLDVSVDALFFTEKVVDKSTQRRQLDTLLDGMDCDGLSILFATAKAIIKARETED